MPANSGVGTTIPLFPPVKCSHLMKTCSAINPKASVAMAKYIPVNRRMGNPIAAPTKKQTTTAIIIE